MQRFVFVESILEECLAKYIKVCEAKNGADKNVTSFALVLSLVFDLTRL